MRIPISDAMVIPGTMCPVNTVGRPSIVMLQMCVDVTLLPSGKLIVIGLLALRRFLTGVPFIMKINVAPVSAIAFDVAFVIAFTHSHCLMKAAAAAYFVVQLDVIIVASSSSCGANAAIWLVDWVGYNEAV
jgi:hypothetical protein